MTQPNPFDLDAALPALTAAIAAGVKQGNAATDTGGPAPAEQMSKMLAIAISQPELYAKGAVAELALDAAMGLITSPMDFRAKLESIQIICPSHRVRLSDAEVSHYDLGAIMQGVLSGDFSNASKELSRSNEIRRHSEITGRLSPGTIAIPLTLSWCRTLATAAWEQWARPCERFPEPSTTPTRRTPPTLCRS